LGEVLFLAGTARLEKRTLGLIPNNSFIWFCKPDSRLLIKSADSAFAIVFATSFKMAEVFYQITVRQKSFTNLSGGYNGFQADPLTVQPQQ
jgi:hypothetical protein